jgi:ribosome-binding factor A
MTRRTERVSELLREEIATIVREELKDPRLGRGLVSITEVNVSPDLRNATVFVSHLGEESERPGVLTALQHASHFLQNELLKRLDIRRVPELRFRLDPSIERGARLADIIHTMKDAERADRRQ